MSRHIARTVNLLRRCRRCVSGNAGVELAPVLPALMLLVLGAIEYGRAYREQLRLARAAHAGALYAAQELGQAGTDAGAAEIEARVRENAGASSGELRVDAQTYCTCPEGPAPDCDPATRCYDNVIPWMYVRVRVSESYSAFADYPGLPATFELSESTEMRVR
jgi:Flp pilus assembly protein TadG